MGCKETGDLVLDLEVDRTVLLATTRDGAIAFFPGGTRVVRKLEM